MWNLTSKNIRSTGNFGLVSNQMLRLYDKLANMKGAPQPNPEHLCKTEFKKNPSNYPLLDKVSNNQSKVAMLGNAPSTGFGG